LPYQAFDARPYGEMRAHDFLGVVCAGSMLFRVEVTRVRALMICRVVHESAGLQQRLELEKDGVFVTTKDIPPSPLPCYGQRPARASVGCLCGRQTTTAHPSQLRRLAPWLLKSFFMLTQYSPHTRRLLCACHPACGAALCMTFPEERGTPPLTFYPARQEARG